MTGRERVATRALVAAMLCAIACRQGTGEDPPFYLEDFESQCDGLPCGWEQIEGDRGQSRYVETIHPGEHGVELRGEGVTIRGEAMVEGTVSVSFSTVQALVVARCDRGDALTIRLAVVDLSSGAIDTMVGAVSPAEDWEETPTVSLTGTGALSPMSITGPNLRFTGITVSKTGTGACQISEIAIDGFGTFGTGDDPDAC